MVPKGAGAWQDRCHGTEKPSLILSLIVPHLPPLRPPLFSVAAVTRRQHSNDMPKETPAPHGHAASYRDKGYGCSLLGFGKEYEKPDGV